MNQYSVQNKWVLKNSLEIPVLLSGVMVIFFGAMCLGASLGEILNAGFVHSLLILCGGVFGLSAVIFSTNYYKAKKRMKVFKYEYNREGIYFEQPQLDPDRNYGRRDLVNALFDSFRQLNILGIEKHSFPFTRFGNVLIYQGFSDKLFGIASVVMVFKDSNEGVDLKYSRSRKGLMSIDTLGYKGRMVFIPGLNFTDAQNLKIQLDNYVTK